MGYDLEWADLPPDAAAASASWESCVESGVPCDHVPTCGEAYFSLADPFQFHLNAAGMGFCRDVMRRAGMTCQGEPLPFPPWPFAGIDDWRSADRQRRDAYHEAERRAGSQTISGGRGIPEFKLRSNDPWLVGVEEIEQALSLYAASPKELRDELEAHTLWVDWLGWLRETSAHGGFTVG